MYEASRDSEMMDDSEKCRFKFSNKLNKRAPTLIADFSNGKLNMNDCEELKFECFKSDVDSDNLNYDAHRNLHTTNGRMNYSGFFNPTGETDTNTLRYFVGVRNKRTGKMKLYDSVLFRMKPIVKPIASDTAVQPPTKKTYWEGVNDLTENFGSKLKKRAMNSRLKYAVDVPDDETLSLNDMSIGSTPDRPIIQPALQTVDYLLPINTEAATAGDVFNINDIITPEEDYALDIEVQSLFNTSEELFKNRACFCNYVNTHFEQGKFDKGKYLIYYNYLVIFQQLGYNEIRKRDPTLDIPEPFKQKMLSTFTLTSKSGSGASSRALPQHIKDKLVAYILALALFIDDFYVDASLVIKDLKNVALPKFCTIAQALGCHIKSQKINDETVKFIELKVPLAVMVPRYTKKKNSSRY